MSWVLSNLFTSSGSSNGMNTHSLTISPCSMYRVLSLTRQSAIGPNQPRISLSTVAFASFKLCRITANLVYRLPSLGEAPCWPMRRAVSTMQPVFCQRRPDQPANLPKLSLSMKSAKQWGELRYTQPSFIRASGSHGSFSKYNIAVRIRAGSSLNQPIPELQPLHKSPLIRPEAWQ